MPKSITEYTLLVSCPSDVRKELDIIKDTVGDFNNSIGKINDAKLVINH